MTRTPAALPRPASPGPSGGLLVLPSTRRAVAAAAASITERASHVVSAPQGAGRAPGPEAASAAVRAWSEIFAPGDPAAFARRLEWDGLDPALAATLMPGWQPPEDWPLPPWTDWLGRIAEAASGVLADLGTGTLDEALPARWSDEPPFVELWIAPLRAARIELGRRAGRHAEARLGPGAVRRLEQQLVREISLVAERAACQQLGEHLAASRTGDASADEDLYQRFVRSQLEAGLEPLFTAFPVLARQVAELSGLWADATAEWLERLETDWPALVDRFLGGRDPGAVADVRPALSDPHEGRRRVMVMEFETGQRLVYKPRDIALEAALSDLLRWCAVRGLAAPPRALEVWARDGYGWVEFAAHAGERDRTGASLFFRQCGTALCLAHALRGRDLHMGNVVATATGPALIDVEMLLQPERRAAPSGPGEDAEDATTTAADSCLTTGLLSHFEVSSGGEVFDVGGLRGEGRGPRSVPRRVWRQLRSASLHPAEETQFEEPSLNRVSCDGRQVRPDDFADDILAGFDAACRFLCDHRDELLARDGPLQPLSRCRSRVIPRPTDQYAMLAATLMGPRYQTDGARRSAAIDILARPFRGAPSRPRIWPLLAEERRALEGLDIPCFSVPCDGTAVMAGGRVVLEGHFTASGLDAVRQRIAGLTDADRLAQRRLLARALSESPRSRLSTPPPATAATAEPTSEVFLEAARWLGREVRHLPPPEGLSLYDGAIGPALFLAALSRASGETVWAEAARAALDPVVRAVDSGTVASSVGGRVGAGDGLGSIVYGLIWIGEWLEDPSLARLAERAAGIMIGHLDEDADDDLLGGTAGAMLALLALRTRGDEGAALEALASCGERLARRQVRVGDGACWPGRAGRRLVGFAHGSAGIGYALTRAAAVVDDHRLRGTAAAALRFTRDAYQPEHRNWPIARAVEPDDRGAGTMMTAWCHGAPGIAIAEMAAAGRQPALLEAALGTSAVWSPARADHLCCGTMGRVDVLLAAGRDLAVPAATAAARSLAARVLARAADTGHFRLSTPGFDYRVFDPGFFRGLSGIGYAWLRCWAPGRVPSVLMFEAPGREETVDG